MYLSYPFQKDITLSFGLAFATCVMFLGIPQFCYADTALKYFELSYIIKL